ncbi:hypothetical protein [Flavobacterium sp. LHD-85]|uniref:hypothetical protein n=1 Tax=Flavobacterium sp. LHD-85 TaxID=3071410 RepID=UPI0027E1CD49|nr:hypothetical protein [Flavobacterium sp. LHD-85]MDQ6530980.1 hypothetical protein [Flavobacterium sp. LHD-85]
MNAKGHCYPKAVILQAAYLKLGSALSYRDAGEIMKIRGVIVTMPGWKAGLLSFTSFTEAIFSSSSRYSLQSFAVKPSTKGFHCYRG